MNGGRKRVILMLVAALLWSVLPASACLLPGHAAGHDACCGGMPQHCPMCSTNMGTSCCQVHVQNVAVSPDLPFPLENLQRLAFVSPRANIGMSSIARAVNPNTIESPPENSPGASSILRI
jgi:hypothetical protein